MRVLLDECLPAPLQSEFSGAHQVETVADRDWTGLSDDQLLEHAESQFDFFVTVDTGIEYEQNLRGSPLGIVIVSAPSNRLDDLADLVPDIEHALTDTNRGDIVHVS